MTHPLITDEMVEKAVIACDAAPFDDGPDPLSPAIRAALSAVIDDVIEACAVEADNWFDPDSEAGSLAPAIAHAIRSLKGPARD